MKRLISSLPFALIITALAVLAAAPALAGPPCSSCDDGTWGGDPATCWRICVSPIVINRGGNDLQLTGVEKPVRFDIDADGELETVTWTDPDHEVGFLVLDRNGNGLIDDGTELFGEHSPQSPSATPNGFEALAFYDRPEAAGNGDGWITADDGIYPMLRIWRDADHNGVSDVKELSTLKAWGIEALAVTYAEPRLQDRHGNWLWWTGLVKFDDGLRSAATDVFFLEVD